MTESTDVETFQKRLWDIFPIKFTLKLSLPQIDRIPFQWQQDKKHSYSPMHDSVKLIAMHSSKGLEFPLVCIPGIGAPTKEEEEEDLQNEARLIIEPPLVAIKTKR